jgi:hypothetical protein
MKNQMKNVIEEDGELPDWYVWSAIQDLDPESTSPNLLQANAGRRDRVRRILDCLLDCDGQPYYLSGQHRPGLFFHFHDYL